MTNSDTRFDLVGLAAGNAQGRVVCLSEALSLWGGFSAETGRIIERSHPEYGVSLMGKILLLPSGRGSSSSSSVLSEAIRRGTAPIGILMHSPDLVLAVGSIIARILYGAAVPVGVMNRRDSSSVRADMIIEMQISGDRGFVEIHSG